jgi:hypothetical protein
MHTVDLQKLLQDFFCLRAGGAGELDCDGVSIFAWPFFKVKLLHLAGAVTHNLVKRAQRKCLRRRYQLEYMNLHSIAVRPFNRFYRHQDD